MSMSALPALAQNDDSKLRRTSLRLAVYIFIVIAAFLLLVTQDIVFTRLISDLNQRINNEQQRLRIGEVIVNDLNIIESNMYKMAVTRNSHTQTLIHQDIQQQVALLHQALTVLEQGGTLERSIRINIESQQNLLKRLTYVRDSNEVFVLEVIDLRPKLDEVITKSDELLWLLMLRKPPEQQPTMQAYFDAIQQTKAYMRGVPPLFRRMKENAARLLLFSKQKTDQLEAIVQQRKRLYHLLEGISVAVIIIIFAIFGYWFNKKLHAAYEGLRHSSQELLATKQAAIEEKNHALQQQKQELNARFEELTHTRNELIQSEKMASLGRLVAGFAHEVNTPIGVAVAAASSLQEHAAGLKRLLSQDEVTEEELLAHLKPIEDASRLTQSNLQRAARLITSFKRTAVDQTSEQQRQFSVAESIEDVINSLHNKFKRTAIKIQVNCPQDLSLYGNAGELEQLLTNLMFNSLIHGFRDGSDSGIIRIDVAQQGDRLLLNYYDDGKGMDAQALQQIFEPFYTTNRHNGGTGLGLFISYNLVTARLKGSIECDSAPQQGVHFRIVIPMPQ